jgi:hypothetical protein
MTDYNIGRAAFASTALLYLTIGLGTVSFWSDAVAAGDPLTAPADWIAALVLTIAMLAVSYLLSGTVTRFAEAKEKGAQLTQWLVVILGVILGFIEAGMTHQGLDWLDTRTDLAPGEALWLASIGLSGMNVFGPYTFGREIPKTKETSQSPVAAPAAPELTEEERKRQAGLALSKIRWQDAA